MKRLTRGQIDVLLRAAKTLRESGLTLESERGPLDGAIEKLEDGLARITMHVRKVQRQRWEKRNAAIQGPEQL